MRGVRPSPNVRLAPLGWLALGTVLVTGLVIALAPRNAEGPVLALAALVLLAIVRGISAERYGADRRPSPAILRHGVVRPELLREAGSGRRASVIPAEPLSEADELDQDLMILQERLRRQACGR